MRDVVHDRQAEDEGDKTGVVVKDAYVVMFERVKDVQA